MSFLEENLRLLREIGMEKDPAADAPAELAVLTAENGSVTAVRDGTYLHSRFDPEKEARRLVESAAAPGIDTAVVYGFGLGYHIEAFFELHPKGRAIVIEPEADFFHAALRVRSFERLFRRDGLRLLIGVPPERTAGMLQEVENEPFQVIRLRSVYARNAEYYARTDEALSRLVSRKEVNLNTLKRFGRLWVRNLVRNIGLIRNSPGIRHLSGGFAGIPALVLAAGPSLDEVLPRLAELRKRCLIIAVDTSFTACLRAGVDPDFVVVVDPQYWNTRHLDRARQNLSMLISESSTHPRIFRLLPGKLFLAGSIFPLGTYIEEASDSKGRLGAGGSVATSAWDFARLLGAGPLVMAGLDLGFPGGNTHYKGSFFEDRSFFSSRRLSPAETHSCAYLFEAGPRRVPANDGGQTLTDRRMLVYVWWFESQMRLHPEAETWNLSRGGARIEGMKPADIETLLALPERRGELDAILSELRATPSPPVDDLRFRSALRRLSAELSRIEALSREGLDAVRRLREGPGEGAAGFSDLDRIDAGIMSLEHRDIAGFLLASTLTDLKPPEKTADSETALRNSEKVYAGLLESAEYHRRALEAAARETVQD